MYVDHFVFSFNLSIKTFIFFNVISNMCNISTSLYFLYYWLECEFLSCFLMLNLSWMIILDFKTTYFYKKQNIHVAQSSTK